MRVVWSAVVFLLAAGLVAGCGGAGTGEVSGTITYDGKPVEAGAIVFTPADGNGPTAGGEIKGGKYTAPKVPVGPAKVSISGARITGTKKMYDDPKSAVVQTSEELLPAKYNKASELRYDVTSGPQTKDFDLPR
ncbi:MAG: hypothetical protein JWO38_3647 [Gemmataceae bacterium]|nr:hypothetical protein [Gemmataceae bacterium]